MAVDLHGHMAYQSYRYFDQGALPLRDVTERLQFAIDDPTTGGVAVRLSGFEGNLSMAWELREKLLLLLDLDGALPQVFELLLGGARRR